MIKQKWRILAGVVLLVGGGFFLGKNLTQKQGTTDSQGSHGMMGQMMTDESAPLQVSEQRNKNLRFRHYWNQRKKRAIT